MKKMKRRGEWGGGGGGSNEKISRQTEQLMWSVVKKVIPQRTKMKEEEEEETVCQCLCLVEGARWRPPPPNPHPSPHPPQLQESSRSGTLGDLQLQSCTSEALASINVQLSPTKILRLFLFFFFIHDLKPGRQRLPT